jgi:hypothetical protein
MEEAFQLSAALAAKREGMAEDHKTIQRPFRAGGLFAQDTALQVI